MPIPTIEWVDGRIHLIDQTLLPNEFNQIYCDDVESVWEAIKSLRVRGAPRLVLRAHWGQCLGSGSQKRLTTPILLLNSKR